MAIDLVLLQPPDTVSWNPTMYFPLSLCYLASVVEKAGYSVKVMDFRRAVGDLPEAKFYGFSCTTPQVVQAKEIAKRVKGITIAGGAHPTLLPNDCIKHFDYVVVGEGEKIILDILAGTVEKGIVKAPRIKNLNEIPYPDWTKVAHPFSNTLFAGERYGEGELAATLIASRGCPFLCGYCANLFRSPVVYRSVENIIGELLVLIEMGIKHFRFEDDNFTIHPDFAELCYALKDLNIHYKCHTRSDLLLSKKAQLLKVSGCEECGLGVESADDRVLKINRKHQNTEQNAEAVKILENSHIRAKTYFMAGLPGETEETLQLNMEFMRKNKPDKWTLSTFSPYPGCDVFNRPGYYGIEITNFDWSKWWNFCVDSFNHIIIGQTSEEMWSRYKRFYSWLREEKWR